MTELIEQAGRVTLTGRAFHNEQMGPFLEELCALTGYPMALPMNTGAEAVETAIRTARKWACTIRGIPAGRAGIVTGEGSFHGRTTTICGFSSGPQCRGGFGPFTPSFDIIPYGSVAAREKALTDEKLGELLA